MAEQEKKANWWRRLKQGLQKTSTKIEDGFRHIFIHKRLTPQMLEELEELLLLSDMGVETTAQLCASLAKEKMDKDVSLLEVKLFLASKIQEKLLPFAKPLALSSASKPHVVFIVGVNGSGKTTTIGKLGYLWKTQGYSVRFVAGDTFRAAAVEQLEIWAQRTNIPLSKGLPNADPASLAFEALNQAIQEKADILLIDTAGRLHNKKNLMEELKKIERVMKKIDPTAPHSTLLVLDATTGQNAISQVKAFKESVGLTGLVVTKLDGTAKGGIVVALCEQFGLPIHAIGVGEGVLDLQPFDGKVYAESMVGILDQQEEK